MEFDQLVQSSIYFLCMRDCVCIKAFGRALYLHVSIISVVFLNVCVFIIFIKYIGSDPYSIVAIDIVNNENFSKAIERKTIVSFNGNK